MTAFEDDDQVLDPRFAMLLGSPKARDTIPHFINERRSVAMALSTRLLLRSLPRLFSALVDRDEPNIDYVVLSSFRTAISTAVWCKYPDFPSNVKGASEAILRIEFHRLDSVVHIANCCAQFFGENSQIRSAELVAGSIDASLIAYSDTEVINQVFADQKNKIPGQSAEQVFFSPLWSASQPPDSFNSAMWYFDHVPTDGPWLFWRNWYQGYFDGRPLNWELQRQIALLDDSIWSAGPEAVSEAIKQIRSRLQIERALADLNSSKSVQTNARHGIGGNNPPERIHDERLSGPITLIWEATEELSTALEEENPPPEQIEAILSKLKSGLADLLKWGALTVKLAVGTVVVIGSKSVTTAVVDAYIAKHPEKIEALIEAVERWLPFLS